MKRRTIFKNGFLGLAAAAIAKIGISEVDAKDNIEALPLQESAPITSDSYSQFLEAPKVTNFYGLHVSPARNNPMPPEVIFIGKNIPDAEHTTGIRLGEGFDTGLDLGGNDIKNLSSITIGNHTITNDDVEVLKEIIKDYQKK